MQSLGIAPSPSSSKEQRPNPIKCLTKNPTSKLDSFFPFMISFVRRTKQGGSTILSLWQDLTRELNPGLLGMKWRVSSLRHHATTPGLPKGRAVQKADANSSELYFK